MDCGKCLKHVSDAEMIKCTSCLTVLHFFCADLSESDFKRILPMNRKKWKCSACKSKKITPTSSVSPKTSLASSLNVDTDMLTKYMDGKLADLRQQWRDDLNAAIFEVTRKLRDDIVSLENRMSTWEGQLLQVEEQVTNTTNTLEKIKSECASQANNMLQEFKRDNESLRAENMTLTAKLAQFDQLSRAANIEIQCVPEHRGENLTKIIQQVGNVIECPVNEQDIHYCSRVAKLDSKSNRPRSILAKFSSPRLRDEFIAASIKFNKANKDNKLNSSHLGIGGIAKSAVYVVEHLTPENKVLHAAARQKAKELKYSYVWVRNGRVFMRKNAESNFLHVKSVDILSRLS
ncbi:uncharacterized protein LOC111001778 [Pieris rapae]|uniref:uncharacterized protein LOC111001778 n=1 Tax=Pieris rapae TaxID=64459 RepID=UPI001E27C5CE|nr:uncharacterized protein LOC111001778 [Pieris rapae]